MRKHTDRGIWGELREGLRFIGPAVWKPSEAPPFRAIVEACEGKGRVSRKRFIKLVMSTGNGKREAEYLAWLFRRAGVGYREALRRLMMPAIQQADRTMERINGAVLIPDE